MKNILLIGTTNIYGGVGHMIFEFCKNIDQNTVHFDFLYYQEPSDEEQDLIASYRGIFYKIPRYSRHPFKFYKRIKEFYRTHHYDAVHIHASTAMLIVYTFPVWKSKNTKIIFQSHSDLIDGFINKLFHKIFKFLVIQHTDYKMAVSQSAARFMYGEKNVFNTFILKNGIDIKRYEFHTEIREKIRGKLNIQDDFVLGHIGRFSYTKNHPFIINVFEKLLEKNINSKLLLVGYGEDEKKIKEIIRTKRLENHIIFYGITKCAEELLCAMDCFIFPSIHEGLGIVALEAQASGLPVVASNNVPKEAAVTDLYLSLSLADSLDTWVNTILSFKDQRNNRKQKYQELSSKGYDILDVTNVLEKIYLEI